MSKHGSVLGGTLLVTGTCVGAGILALPLATAMGGFVPSLITFLISWLFMCATGLLFLEICLWLPEETNIISMARYTLGKWGGAIAWILYLYLFYSLTVAYISGSGTMLFEITDGQLTRPSAMIFFVLVFGPIVYFGTRPVDKTNLILIAGLGITYVIFIAMGIPHIKISLLQRANWGESWKMLPLVFVTFAYQGIVPTLTQYLGRNPHKVRRAIIFGSFIPFAAYVIWEWMILGIIPLDRLQSATLQGSTALSPLRYILETPWLFLVGEFFAFFALTSSFLGVTLGLRDFLSDGLNIKKSPLGRLGLCLLIFTPALFIALIDPRLFLFALRYGGGIGTALLLGLLPVLMVWVGRYIKKIEGPFKVHGGKMSLLLLGAFVLFELLLEILQM